MIILLLILFSARRGRENGESHKSYRQVKLEQNIWRCDCGDEGQHIDIDRHEESCLYGVWYYAEDMHKEDNDENKD